MSALDAFLWTLTVMMWLLMAGLLTAVGVTIWDDLQRRRASKAPKEPATLHVIRQPCPETDAEFRERILRNPDVKGCDPGTLFEIETAIGYALDAAGLKFGVRRRVPATNVHPKESA